MDYSALGIEDTSSSDEEEALHTEVKESSEMDENHLLRLVTLSLSAEVLERFLILTSGSGYPLRPSWSWVTREEVKSVGSEQLGTSKQEDYGANTEILKGSVEEPELSETELHPDLMAALTRVGAIDAVRRSSTATRMDLERTVGVHDRISFCYGHLSRRVGRGPFAKTVTFFARVCP